MGQVSHFGQLASDNAKLKCTDALIACLSVIKPQQKHIPAETPRQKHGFSKTQGTECVWSVRDCQQNPIQHFHLFLPCGLGHNAFVNFVCEVEMTITLLVGSQKSTILCGIYFTRCLSITQLTRNRTLPELHQFWPNGWQLMKKRCQVTDKVRPREVLPWLRIDYWMSAQHEFYYQWSSKTKDKTRSGDSGEMAWDESLSYINFDPMDPMDWRVFLYVSAANFTNLSTTEGGEIYCQCVPACSTHDWKVFESFVADQHWHSEMTRVYLPHFHCCQVHLHLSLWFLQYWLTHLFCGKFGYISETFGRILDWVLENWAKSFQILLLCNQKELIQLNQFHHWCDTNYMTDCISWPWWQVQLNANGGCYWILLIWQQRLNMRGHLQLYAD